MRLSQEFEQSLRPGMSSQRILPHQSWANQQKEEEEKRKEKEKRKRQGLKEPKELKISDNPQVGLQISFVSLPS